MVKGSHVMAGAALYFGTAVGSYLYLRSSKAPSPTAASDPGREQLPAGSGPQAAFDALAPEYDRRIDLDETLMGVKLLRRWLLRKAQGDVLEVSAGTGRNLPYYDLRGDGVRSLTLVDTSAPMLRVAYERLRDMDGDAAPAEGGAVARVHVCLADAQALVAPSSSSGGGNSPAERSSAAEQPGGRQWGPELAQRRSFQPQQFDVVVDTFGLCSHPDPVRALKEMARVCKRDGRVLLLEHGRGSWNWVNSILDGGAAQHRAKWGCEWNRDIEQAVRQAGLRILSMRRWHFGTTYVIEAAPDEGVLAS